MCTPLSRRRSVHHTNTNSGELWLSRSVSSASARSARRTTASSSPTRAPSATVASSRRSASTTRPRSPRSSRSTPSVRSTGCRVGAQPTEQVAALLKLTGDWGRFKGDANAVSTVQGRRAEGRLRRDGSQEVRSSEPKAEKPGCTESAPPRPRSPKPRTPSKTVLAAALEHLVKGIVDHPDEVHRRRPPRRRAARCSRCVCTPTTAAA